jgi:hypothetical protein
MTREGPSAAILTLIAPAAPGTAITALIGQQSRGWYRLQLRIGGRQIAFLVSADGSIQPG